MSKVQEMIGGHKMPTVGFGTAQLRGDDLETALNAALECGYRHIDTANLYQNEDAVGRVLKTWFDSGKLKREDVFVTTKLPNNAVHEDKVEELMKKSLTALQLDYVDLYLIHFPIYMEMRPPTGPPKDNSETRKGPPPSNPLPTDHIAVWKKMEEQVAAGRTKTIGLSNFNEKQIERIWNVAKIKPSCLQVELSPFLQTPNLVDYCQKKGIVVVAYSTLKQPPAEDEKLKDLNVFTNDVIKKIAQKHKKSTAQIALRYLVQKNIVIIPRSSNPDRMKENLHVFDFSLDVQDLQDLAKLDKGEDGRRMNMAGRNPKIREHPEYPYPK